jgi:hypothetical protein
VFDPGPVHVRFVVHIEALGQGFLRELRVSLVNIIPPMLTFFIYTLLLPEGQTGEGWCEPSEKQCSFGNRTALGRKELSLVFIFKCLTSNQN